MELEHLGFNALTISFIATLFFSALGAWGLYDQSKNIWTKRSGESISNIFFICSAFLFVSILIYGISIGSIALMFSGICRGSLHIPVLLGLKRFKGFTKWERWLFYLLLMTILIMIISPGKGLFFIVICTGVIIPTASQPFKIWRRKSAGVVSIKMLTIYTISTSFWVIYSISIRDLPILIFCSISMMLFLSTIGLWFLYRGNA